MLVTYLWSRNFNNPYKLKNITAAKDANVLDKEYYLFEGHNSSIVFLS